MYKKSIIATPCLQFSGYYLKTIHNTHLLASSETPPVCFWGGGGDELNMVNYVVAPPSDMNLFNIKILIVDTFRQFFVKLKYVENCTIYS